MKKFLVLFILLILNLFPVFADIQAKIEWTPCGNGLVTGFKIYYTIIPSNSQYYIQANTNQCNTNAYIFSYTNVFSNFIIVTNNGNYSAVITNLSPGVSYAFAMSSLFYETESSLSSQVPLNTPFIYNTNGPQPKLNMISKAYSNNSFSISSDLWIEYPWAIYKNNDLATTNWVLFKSGTNSLPSATITNIGNGNAFFKLAIFLTEGVTTTNNPIVNNTYFFGNTNNGTSTDTLYDAIPYINYVRHTSLSNVVLSNIFAKLQATIGKYKFAIYSNLNSAPYTLLGSTFEVVNPTTPDWYSSSLQTPVSISQNTDYWLAIWSDSPNGAVFYSDKTKTLGWQGLSYGNWPNQASISGTSLYNYCLYAK